MIFAEVMKYFRHVVMGHEIFLKIFDGPQKFFLFSSFLSFLVISFKNLWWSRKKLLKLAMKGISKKIRHVKQQVKSSQVYDKL